MAKPDPSIVGQGLTILVIMGVGLLNHFKRSRADRAIGAQLNGELTELKTTIEGRLTRIDSNIAEVRAFCVGPDGENGFRADMREVKARVIGLEERERDRLAEDRLHGPLDRRTSA